MDAKDGSVSLLEDIVFEVLARLPEKALCRFRCVCKGWRALISDPAFVAAQKSRSHAADPYLVGVFFGSPPEVRLMDMDGNIVKAFNFQWTRSTPLPPQLTTRPDLICTDGSGTVHGGIIIDPAAGEAFTAFGTSDADHSAMSYATILGRAAPSGIVKVFRLDQTLPWDDDGGGQQLCEVATIMDSSGSGAAEALTWRRKSAPPFTIIIVNNEHRAIVNGVIYFIHELEIDDDVDEDDDVAMNLNCIVAFDLESEEWKAEVIDCPTLKFENEGWSIVLAELNGSLAFVHMVLVNEHPNTNIWRLVDPGKSVWVKEYMIPLSKNYLEPAKPVGALVDGRILLWSIMDEIICQNIVSDPHLEVVQFYNPNTKVFTDFMEMTRCSIYTLVFYTGSLLS